MTCFCSSEWWTRPSNTSRLHRSSSRSSGSRWKIRRTGRKALEVSSYSFTHRGKLFLDANIWWYVYGSQKPDDTLVKIYSQAFDRILKAQSCIRCLMLVRASLTKIANFTLLFIVGDITLKLSGPEIKTYLWIILPVQVCGKNSEF